MTDVVKIIVTSSLALTTTFLVVNHTKGYMVSSVLCQFFIILPFSNIKTNSSLRQPIPLLDSGMDESCSFLLDF